MYKKLCALVLAAVALVVMAACDPMSKSKAQQAGEAAAHGKAAVALVALGYKVDTVEVYPERAAFLRAMCKNGSPSCSYAYRAWTSTDGNSLLDLESGMVRCKVPQAWQDLASLKDDVVKQVLGAPDVYAGVSPADRLKTEHMGVVWSCFDLAVTP